MTHKKFDPAKRNNLNNPERLKWLNPEQIWTFMEIESPQTIADIGAGTGYLTFELCQHLREATLHVFDIEPLMITEITQSAPAHLSVVPHLMKNHEMDLEEASIDLVWMINLYHELEQPLAFLTEIKRVLKPGGKLLILDWAKDQEACFTGPPLDHRVAEPTISKHLQEAGFNLLKSTYQFTYHLGMLAQKPERLV